jgi:hypothetical protein
MEPLSAFSLSLAILNIFLSTIPSIREKADWIINLRDKLERYHRILFDCDASFRVWLGLWDRPQENERGLRELFGLKGLTVIQDRKAVILKLLEEIHGSLCLSNYSSERRIIVTRKKSTDLGKVSSMGKLTKRWKNTRLGKGVKKVDAESGSIELEPDELRSWRDLTQSLDPTNALDLKPEPSLIRRILGILGTNQQLGVKISDLSSEVDRLHKVSRDCYKLMGHGEQDPKPQDIKIALNKVEFRTLANIFSATLNKGVLRSHSSKWFLELYLPPDSTESKTVISQIVDDCAMFFTIADGDEQQRSKEFKEIRMKQLKGASIPRPAALELLTTSMNLIYEQPKCVMKLKDIGLLEFRTLSTPTLWTKTWRTLLESSYTSSTVRKVFELERARMAFGLTIWIILLWETDWLSHICSCAFRCVLYPMDEENSEPDDENEELDDGQRHRKEHVYSTKYPHNESPPAGSVTQNEYPPINSQGPAIPIPEAGHHNDSNCSRHSTAKDKLYLLGLFLSELLLAAPIELRPDTATDDNEDHPTRKFESNLDILWALESHRGPGKSVKDAVQFCFDHAKDPDWTEFDHSGSAERTGLLIEKVLEPIRTYYSVVNKHFGEKWSKQFIGVAISHEDDNFAFERFEDAAEVLR